MKFVLIHLRKSVRLILLLLIGACLIGAILYFLYKPTYAVYLDGELVGYTDEKKELQDKINLYIKSGDGKEVAFYEIDSMPEYEEVYSKKDVTSNDEEIFDTVIAKGTPYYKQYAILVDKEEKYYVSSYDEAEEVINELKKKKSTNIKEITYSVKYSSDEKQKETKTSKIVSKLYKKPVEKKKVSTTNYYSSGGGNIRTGANISFSKVALGVSLKRPISGTISSRFGSRSSVRSSIHTGLDIAARLGTPIKAAAGGTVVHAGWKGSLGKLIVISHGNGVQTYYAHCNSIGVSAGQKVSQGEVIGKVGSTGNSTGPHLHLEIRVNGVAYNPQNWLY